MFLPGQGVAGFCYHLLGYGPPADDDEATAQSRIDRMTSATLRRPISCSSVAAAIRPSQDLRDSSELPGRYLVPDCKVTMSPGTRQVRPTPSSQRASMALAHAVLVMPRLRVQPRSGLGPQDHHHGSDSSWRKILRTSPCLTSRFSSPHLLFLFGIVGARRFPDTVPTMS